MNLINQVRNFFKLSQRTPFTIYEIDALSAETEADRSQFTAIQFDSAYRYGYRNDVKLPYQPLENGSFSTDSVLDNPFFLKVTGAITQAYTSDSVVQDYAGIEDVIGTLQTYLENEVQLVIFKAQPFFTTYQPLHLASFDYEVSPDNITLYADMVFQEVRAAGTDASPTTNPGLSDPSTLQNPTNANITDSGVTVPSYANDAATQTITVTGGG